MPNQYNPTAYTLVYPTLVPPLQVRPGDTISYPTLLPQLVATGNSPTTPPADTLTRIIVTGRLTTDGGAAQIGAVVFRPTVFDAVGDTLFTGNPISAGLNGAGTFSVLLPATDDPNTATPGFRYLVTEPSGYTYTLVVPMASPGGVLDLGTAARIVAGSGSGITLAQATAVSVALSLVLG